MPRDSHDLIVIGGGAAGFFGAIAAAEHGVGRVLILEASRDVLTKVRISGGGRCNVTHDCPEPAELVKRYPRGERSLRGPFHRWRVGDTIEWFGRHGVELKTEADGRMFPTTDRSQTVIDCLTTAARDLGVEWRTRSAVEGLDCEADGSFRVRLKNGDTLRARRVLVAIGGMRGKEAPRAVTDTGHASSDPVPSLFTFHIDDERLADLQGVACPHATVRAVGREMTGPVLITHWGLSGPAILKLSAWGARDLAERGYRFPLSINWTGDHAEDRVREILAGERNAHGARTVAKRSLFDTITQRLWARLCHAADIGPDQTWSRLPKSRTNALIAQLTRGEFQVTGKSLNKDEFVTCGGVHLRDLDLKTMESKHHPGLHFAGEVLDVDGITGGFNFQAAWTTGRLAGEAIAAMMD